MKTNFETLRDMYRKEGSDLFRVRNRSARREGQAGRRRSNLLPIASERWRVGSFMKQRLGKPLHSIAAGVKVLL